MNNSLNDDWPTIVAGFGSPYGDDQAGWRLVTLLQQAQHVPARAIAIVESTDLLLSLENCSRLIVVDACRTGKAAGTITRLCWPDPRIVECHSHSTHGMGVADILKLAQRLGRMPTVTEVIGIELLDCSPGRDVSPVVSQAVEKLAKQLVTELREVSHA